MPARLLMEIRYFRDSEPGPPHIYNHGVTEAEVEFILAHPGEDDACARGSRQALGQTAHGRNLRVIYVPDEEGDGVFVVTAYARAGKQLKAFRRRRRRRRRRKNRNSPRVGTRNVSSS
jgi:hypothetical protein